MEKSFKCLGFIKSMCDINQIWQKKRGIVFECKILHNVLPDSENSVSYCTI